MVEADGPQMAIRRMRLECWITEATDTLGICNAYRGADNSLVRPTSRYILFDGENISFAASLVIYT